MKLVLYKTSYNRVPKTLPYSVDIKSWDKNRQRLKSSSSNAVELNLLLDAMHKRLEEQVLLWEKDGYNWTPEELRDTLDENKSKRTQESLNTQTSVVYWIDYQIQHFNTIERSKNGKLIVGSANANNYQWLRNSLSEFTTYKYKKDFSLYRFNEITEKFLRSYAVYIQQKGYKNGDKGGLRNKLKTFKAVFNVAQKQNVEGVNINVFHSVSNQIKTAKTTPKTTTKNNINLIKDYDRKELSSKESFWLDLFLFSYYAGGMPNVDVCYLNTSCLKDTYIEYTRQKCDNVATPAFLPEMRAIIAKYSNLAHSDYVFPIFSHKLQTELQKRQKVERISSKVNRTLRKVCECLNISDKITWYSARGTYITNMINAGINPHAVANQAGNSVKVIEKHYYHVADRTDMLKQISAAI